MKKKLIITVAAALFSATSTTSALAQTNKNLDARLKALEKRLEIVSEKASKINSSSVISALSKAQLFGRLQVDANWYNEGQATDNKSDGIDIARVRLGIKGKVSENLSYKFENDFAKNQSNVKDAYLAYTGFENATIVFGQTKPTISLELLESSNHMDFINRSVAETDVPGRLVGVKADKRGDKWRIAAGFFGESVGNESRYDDSKYTMTARATTAPINNDESLLHLGVATSYTSSDRNTDATTKNTFDSENLISGELIARYKKFTLQSEYFMNNSKYDADAGTGERVSFPGYYIQASIFLTGEQRKYSTKAAKLGKIKVKSAVGKGGIGAVQLAARFSSLNQNDKSVTDGDTKNYTLGVNWFLNNNVRLMLDYTKSKTDFNGASNDTSYDNVGLRTRFYF